ncbi:MAG TPA: tonB-system energizer ExbB [Methylocella sp.]|nr:tonB-system energizer ExbB [Methylocella sp.]
MSAQSWRPFGFSVIAALIVATLTMGAAVAQGGATSPVSETPPATPTGPAPAVQPSDSSASVGPGDDAQPLHPPQATPAVLPSKLPRDLTPWGMFQNAEVPVKLVMIGLAIASLVTWTVWLAKTIELVNAKRQVKRELETLVKAVNLAAAATKLSSALRTPIARLVTAAASESERSEGLAPEGVKDRTATLLSRIEAQEGRRILRGTGFLATIGATAPFVGLFGTVWGIMDSFIGISKTDTTNLAVVAPGIAEALLSTALGLIAAIPAVVMYNAFARSITSYRAHLGDAAAEVLRHLSRDLDRTSSEPKSKAAIVSLRPTAE